MGIAFEKFEFNNGYFNPALSMDELQKARVNFGDKEFRYMEGGYRSVYEAVRSPMGTPISEFSSLTPLPPYKVKIEGKRV